MVNTDLYRNREQAAGVLASYRDRVAQVSADADLSVEGRQRRIAADYIATSRRLQELAAQEQSSLSARQSDLERRLFGAGGRVSGMDPAMQAISARDASERASQLGGPSDAVALLRRAEQDGDELLARAVARHAMSTADVGGLSRVVSEEWTQVVRDYVAARPNLEPVVNELAEIESLTERQVFSPYSLPEPRDIPPSVINAARAEQQVAS